MTDSPVKKAVFVLLLFVISISASLAMGEAVLRLLFDPIDYLHPDIQNDPVLGVRIKPYSAGHDSWGYRNRSVPEKADIVAIGDSQTYGVSATSRNSWPALLGEITGRTVYNLSLPGYDPTDYYYLMQAEAFKLNPAVIIVGFYFGNDLSEAYRNVYSRSHWEGLRKQGFVPEKNIPLKSVESVSDVKGILLGNIRGWLSHNSLFYRIATSYIKDTFKLNITKYRDADNNFIEFQDKKTGINTSLTPVMRLGAVDISDNRIQEGLRITLEVFKMMKRECDQKNIRLIILLIPTKESVLAKYIEDSDVQKKSADINELILKERKVRDIIKAELTKQDISFVETVGPLSDAAGVKPVYPRFDGHPNKDGYGVIAKTVSEFLNDLRSRVLFLRG